MNISDLRQSLAQNGLSIESFDVQVGHDGGTDVWARREDFESTSELARTVRTPENADANQIHDSDEIRRRGAVRSPGYIDIWM